jgi:hypothetical protein
MKQYAEHNKIGVCHSLREDNMYVRTFSGGYPYISNGVILRSSSTQPIYSYGKNYEKDDKKFALFVWTTINDQEKIKEAFDSVASSVTDDQISQVSQKGSFIYINDISV